MRLWLTLLVWMVALPVKADVPRILVIGDSLLAAHSFTKRSVGDHLATMLQASVRNRPVSGARMIYRLPLTGAMGLSIPQQFHGAGWDWVVMNGGGNDLWLGCGCHRCDRKLDKLITRAGTQGAIPHLMAKARRSGAQVVYVGYLRSPGIQTLIEGCKDEGDTLEARVADLADRSRGVHYVSLQDLVPHGDRSYFGIDLIHPSLKASKAIAARIADVIGGK